MIREAEKAADDMGLKPYYLYRQKNIAGNFENVGYAKVDKAGIYNILIMEERNPLGTERIGKLIPKFAIPSIISMVVSLSLIHI